jgi:hypothetical protein
MVVRIHPRNPWRLPFTPRKLHISQVGLPSPFLPQAYTEHIILAFTYNSKPAVHFLIAFTPHSVYNWDMNQLHTFFEF